MAKIRFQDVKFRSVDECLDYLPEEELKVVTLLRNLVFECLPDVSEKLSYNVPFYRMHKGVFFIWPASVKWGKTQSWSGVRFGFQQGYLLSDHERYLDKGTRRQVYRKNFSSVKDVNPDLLRSHIYEAAMIGQERAAGKERGIF